MDLRVQEALERLSANPAYVRRFQAAFGPGRVTQEKVERALATYERGIVSSPAPFDRWVAGDEAVSDAAKRGFALFDGKAGCSGCTRAGRSRTIPSRTSAAQSARTSAAAPCSHRPYRFATPSPSISFPHARLTAGGTV
jgi:cytochrome c peroxidase